MPDSVRTRCATSAEAHTIAYKLSASPADVEIFMYQGYVAPHQYVQTASATAPRYEYPIHAVLSHEWAIAQNANILHATNKSSFRPERSEVEKPASLPKAFKAPNAYNKPSTTPAAPLK